MPCPGHPPSTAESRAGGLNPTRRALTEHVGINEEEGSQDPAPPGLAPVPVVVDVLGGRVWERAGHALITHGVCMLPAGLQGSGQRASAGAWVAALTNCRVRTKKKAPMMTQTDQSSLNRPARNSCLPQVAVRDLRRLGWPEAMAAAQFSLKRA
jgi:hypothetical protein